MAQQFGLGRGLSSLIPNKQPKPASVDDFSKTVSGATDDSIRGDKYIIEVDVNQIVANPQQPRMQFDEDKLEGLAQSIKAHGIIQPLIVSKKGNLYELVAGERRFQAAQKIGLKKVPVIVREADELQKLELAIVENVQRHDLNPIEEGMAYQKLGDEFQLGQEEIAVKIGKSRSLIANKIRLLSLPIDIQKGLVEGKITEGHAKAILSVQNPEKQRALYELILKNNLTVRQVEEKTQEVSVRSHKRVVSVDPQVKELEKMLVEILGTKVKISKAGDGGKIVIEYYSKEDLEALLEKISQRK
jgi:ParB family transcriptional regulator, chromosome partitioning protein